MAGRRLDGRIAVVTGGASGIGAAVARRLADQGARIEIVDVDAAGAERVAREVGGRAHRVDVRQRAELRAMFGTFPHPIDVLVTCAGGAERRAALDIDDALLEETFALNAAAFLRCAQEAARSIIAAGRRATFIHVASSLYRGPAPGLAHFAAAKAASVTLVRCLAHEWARSGIRVNAVISGPAETPMTAPVWDAQPQLRAALVERLPLGRIGEPDDVAAGVSWLASDEAAWVTGSLLTIDGGLQIAS